MPNKLFSLLFPPKKNSTQAVLEAEILYLRTQNQSLLEALLKATAKPELKVTDPEDRKPKKFDATKGTYVPMTDAEIEEGRQALSQLSVHV